MSSQTKTAWFCSTLHRWWTWWWLRPIMTLRSTDVNDPATNKETAVMLSTCVSGVFTVLIVFSILSLTDKVNSHPKFSIQSIAVEDSSATWHVDFLVKNPSSRHSIYYDGDDVTVRLGSLNVAVLNISDHKRISRDLAAFSLAFVAEGNGNGVVYEQLDIKLRGKYKTYGDFDDHGHFVIKCQNLTRSHEKIPKINCKSSFFPSSLFDVP